MLTIRRSTVDDIPVMMSLYAAAKRTMRADGNMEQWNGPYPAESNARSDIERGISYIIENDGRPVGTFAFIPDVEPTYAEIFEGSWIDDVSPYATIHRLAGTPECHGIAYACFEWCMARCREGCPDGEKRTLRIDTHKDNHIMQHVIARFGFIYCGIIYLADGNPRLAYQKL